MRKSLIVSLVLLLAVGMVLSACSSSSDNATPGGEKDAGKVEGKKDDKAAKGDGGEEGGNVKLVYVNWDSETASTNVIKKVLEDEGFNVEITAVDNAPMWAAVADGSADGMVAAWLPATHKGPFAKYGDQVVDLGVNLEGAKIGLVVPEYVDIKSIEEMNKHKDKFNKKIVGIEPGAGVMEATENAIKDYNLELELQQSSSAAMTAELTRAIGKKEWIAVTGWTPHWKFAKYDLKYLEDPKGIYGDAESIHTIVRKGLKEEMPRVHEILDNFSWTVEDMEAVMLKIEEGESPEKAAEAWVNDNPDKVKEWTGK